MKSCKSLNAFLKKHKRTKNGPFTHTRIGDHSLGMFGGSYFIPTKDRNEFYKLYYKHVFVDKKAEYLTEAQNKEGSAPLLVDIDMRYSTDITERQHTEGEINDILDMYLDSIQELYNLNDEITFPVFIFEKPEVNALDEVTKDGIHIVFGISMTHDSQLVLRDIVMKKEKTECNIFENLGCVNNVDDIFDECISSGRNNWQMWGSTKPNYIPYELTYAFAITLSDDEYDKENIDITTLEIKNLLPVVSAQNTTFTQLNTVKDKYKEIIEKFQENRKKKKTKKSKKSKQPQYNSALLTLSSTSSFTKLPKNEKELDQTIETIMNYFDIKDYHIKEIHEMTMCLGESYYEPFKNWLNVGWALHNTHDSLFWTWIKFSQKSKKFNWDDIPDLLNKWKNEMGEGFTWRSIYYWAKQDNLEEFNIIQNNSIDRFVQSTLDGNGSDTDLAILTKHLFKGEYCCVSIKNNKWYRFKNHRWVENDCGTSLRSELSKKINKLYVEKARSEKDMAANSDYSEGLIMEFMILKIRNSEMERLKIILVFQQKQNIFRLIKIIRNMLKLKKR